MKYRILRQVEWDEAEHAMKPKFYCLGKKILGKWKVLTDNDKDKEKMIYSSLKKAKSCMQAYLLRDIAKRKSAFDWSRYCDYVDTDFLEVKIID